MGGGGGDLSNSAGNRLLGLNFMHPTTIKSFDRIPISYSNLSQRKQAHMKCSQHTLTNLLTLATCPSWISMFF